MNLVILNDFGFVNGGAAQVAINTAMAMAEKGHNVFYICAVNPIDLRLKNHSRINVICTQQKDILKNQNRLGAIFQGVWNFKANREVTKLLRSLSQKDTVIHIHGWTKALSHSSIYPIIKYKFGSILSLHDYFIGCPNGGFYNYQKQIICPLRGLSLKCIFTNCDSRSYGHKIWRTIRSFIQRYFVGIPFSISNFISMSELSTEILSPYLPKSARLHQLPNPIDIQKPDRVEVEHNQKFFAIGRFSPEKGFDLVAEAARRTGIELVFIGNGPEKENLSQINPDAIFFDWLPRKELFEQIRSARAIIFSSKWYETQGLIIAEASGNGVPCVVSDVSAGRESIIDHQTGLLFESNNIDDLILKINLLGNDEIIKQLSENVFNQYWQNPNTKENYFNKLEIIFNEILDSINEPDGMS